MKKRIFCLLMITIVYLVVVGVPSGCSGDDQSSFRIRAYSPLNSTMDYQNMYLYYGLHYVPTEKIVFNICAVKGSGDKGYYPAGYLGASGGGLYEKGSYYLMLRDVYGINKIILGNYIPLFGQGLVFGSIFPVLLSSPYYTFARYRDGIYPTGTTSKTILLEGIALEYAIGNLYLRPFISWNRYDCSAGESSYYLYNDNDADGIPNQEDPDDFTGMQEEFPSGYSCKNDIMSCIAQEPDYQYSSDREKRNNLREVLAGLNISSTWDKLKAGYTLSYAAYNRLVDPYYSYDPNKGNKTGYMFRGKNLFSSSAYFKLYSEVEIFGEAAATFHKNYSYYEEFNGGSTFSAAFSGGLRKKVNQTGLILWGAYIPPNFINPHGQEYPDGVNNTLCGLAGSRYARKGRELSFWVYLHKELYNKDDPDNPENGFLYHYRIGFGWGENLEVLFRQSLEAINNYYYAPGSRSYKITSKASLRYAISPPVSIICALENRAGAPAGEVFKKGTGLSAEALYSKKDYDASFLVLYFNTDHSRYAYLYPYERSVYRWSFVPASLYGKGLLFSIRFIQNFTEQFVWGGKLRCKLDAEDPSRSSVTLYCISEFYF